MHKINTTETDPNENRRQRRLEAAICSTREAERENQRPKHFIDELRRLEAKLCFEELKRPEDKPCKPCLGLCSKEAERGNQRPKHFIEELADRIEARIEAARRRQLEEKRRRLEEEWKKADQVRFELLAREVAKRAEKEIRNNRGLASIGEGKPQDRVSEQKTFTKHIAGFNRAWAALPEDIEGHKKRGHPVSESHCRQIINRNKNRDS